MSLLQFQRLLIVIFEAGAFFTGLCYWNKYKNTPIRFVIIYLGVVTLVEFIANRLMMSKHFDAVNIIYAYFIPLEFIFWYWFFLTVGTISKKKFYLFCLILLTVILIIIEQAYLLKKGRYFFLSLQYSVSNILLVIIVLKYLLDFVKTNAFLYYKQNPVFWISVGVLIFYLGTFPLYAMYNSLWEVDKDLFRKYYAIQFILNYSMYILFILSFIWGKPKYLHSSF